MTILVQPGENTHIHTHTHARTHALTHALTHTHTHTCTHTRDRWAYAVYDMYLIFCCSSLSTCSAILAFQLSFALHFRSSFFVRGSCVFAKRRNCVNLLDFCFFNALHELSPLLRVLEESEVSPSVCVCVCVCVCAL